MCLISPEHQPVSGGWLYLSTCQLLPSWLHPQQKWHTAFPKSWCHISQRNVSSQCRKCLINLYIPTPNPVFRKIKVTICNHQVDSPLYVWPDVWSGDCNIKKYSHTWHRMSLLRPGVTKQHKHKPHIAEHTSILRGPKTRSQNVVPYFCG